jgi:hypothetical protein
LRPKRFPAPELKAPTRDSMTTIFTQSVAIHQIHSTSPLLICIVGSSSLLRHAFVQTLTAAKKKRVPLRRARAGPVVLTSARSLSLSSSLDPLSCLLRLSHSLSRCWLAPSLLVASDVCTTVWAERTQQSAKLEAFLKNNLGGGSFFL